MLSFLRLGSESHRSKLSDQQGAYKKESGRELPDSFFEVAGKLQKDAVNTELIPVIISSIKIMFSPLG